MGGIGCECCGSEEGCCLCDEALAYDAWSVSVFGKTFSGIFPELADPPVVCNVRTGDDCIVDSPAVIQDCVQEGSWGSTTPLLMGFLVCFEACPQCICDDLTSGNAIEEACLKTGLINWEKQAKGVTHSRTWQQESFYSVAAMICCNDPADSVKFTFDLYYQVSRFGASSSQVFQRFRSVSYDCIYPGGEAVTDPSNLVRSDWIEPVAVGSKPPCLPCDWGQSDFFGNCDTVDSDCPEYTGGGDAPWENVDYVMSYVAITCNFISLLDLDDNEICPIPDSEGGTTFIYYGTHTQAAYGGSQTDYCGNSGNTCYTDTLTVTREYSYESECIPCSELTSTVELHRTSAPIGEDVTATIYTSRSCDCGTVDGLTKTIPATITMTLS